MTTAQIGPHHALRLTVAAAGACGALVAATGIVQSVAFDSPSLLKYALTILGPLFVVAAATAEHPLRFITAPAIVAAPFVGFETELSGIQISVVIPFLVAGALVATASGAPPGRRASLAAAGMLAFPLMLIPLAQGSDTGEFVTSLALLVAMAWLVSRTAEEPAGMRLVLGAMVVSASLQAAIAVWQARTGQQLDLYAKAGSSQFAADFFYTYGDTRRPVGALSDPISLGNVLAITLPLVVVLAVELRGWRRLLLVGVGLLIGTAIALSLTRMSWVAAVVGCVVTLAVLPRVHRRRVVPVVVVGVALVSAVALAFAGPAVRARFASLKNPTAVQGQSAAQRGVSEGDRNRLEYWRIALRDGFGGHPIAGLGIGDLGPFLRDHSARAGRGVRDGTAIYVHAHSTYFHVIAEAGMFGIALLVVFLGGLARDARAGLRAYPVLGAGLAGASVALLVCWITDWVVHIPAVAAVVGVLLGAVAAAGRRGRRPPDMRLRA